MTADSMDLAPVTAPKTSLLQPAWLEAVSKYRNLLFMVVGGLLLLSVLIKIFLSFLPRRDAKASTVEKPPEELELAAALRRAQAREISEALAAPKDSKAVPPSEPRKELSEAHAETADRVRQFAQKDPALSANVLRMWLHNQKV
jgi:flagellar biosynthesis/type III secretory pathway M-ring protein FliF/YscJ